MVVEKAVRDKDVYSAKDRKPDKKFGKYQHSRNLYRLQYERQIKPLFDKFSKQEGTHYYGKISGVEARIDFNTNSSCTLMTKTELDLEIAYKKVLKELIGRN